MQKSAFLMVILTDRSTVTVLLSHETRNFDSLASTSNDNALLSGTTTGLTFKLCGAIGVTTKF
jgi:hypothetical protein